MATNNNTTTTSSWGTNALDLNTSSQSAQELNNMVQNEEMRMDAVEIIDPADLPHLLSSELSTTSSSSSSVSSTFLEPIIPLITPAMDHFMAKKYYELHGNDKKILFAMATGIVDPNDLEGRTISFDREPYL